ncbi:MAG TPA: amino acid permease, partial [Terriglobales bacterium]|nr:amino acid permease [Terriglobales bacterium]
YLREAYHPMVGFLYGWVLLLVIQTGGMAAVAVTFARYFLEVTGWQAREWIVGATALGLLTLINCLGVRPGGTVQSVLMVMKIAAITLLVGVGWALAGASRFSFHPLIGSSISPELLSSFVAAMVPVLFAYGGWQTASFVATEMRNPAKDLPRGLLIGVGGVITLYVAVAFVCVRVLGAAGLASTTTPASAVMKAALGPRGGTLAALAIAVSTLGFLSQSILTAPRVYFAMARDGVFFRSIAKVNQRTRAPVFAILLQSAWTVVIALSGRYEQILNYVVSMDFIFFGLTALSLFIFRRRDGQPVALAQTVPGHPYSTALFIAASWLVVLNAIYRYPANTLAGMFILFLGVPVYFVWRRSPRAEGVAQ